MWGREHTCPLGASTLLCPAHPALALTLQSAEPVKRQPRSQCLSTLVRPVFGEVRARHFLHGVNMRCMMRGADQLPLLGVVSRPLRAHWGWTRIWGPGFLSKGEVAGTKDLYMIFLRAQPAGVLEQN